MPPRTPRIELYDRLLNGELKNLLLGWKAEEVTLDDQALRLRTEHDIDVSRETVRRWHLVIAEPSEAAS